MKIKSKLLNFVITASIAALLLIPFFYAISSNNRQDKVLVISADVNSRICYNIYEPASSTDSSQKFRGSWYDLEEHSPGVYITKTNTLYYSKPMGNSGFQLYKKVMGSSEETKICSSMTDRFTFADFIDVNSKSSTLYLRVIQKGHRNIQLAAYDIAKDEITIWDEKEQDMTCSSFNYLYSKNIVLVTKYSLSADDRKRLSSKSNDNTENSTAYEVSTLSADGKHLKTLEKSNNIISDVDMSSNGRYMLTVETDTSKPEMEGRTFLKLKDTLRNTTEIIASDKTGYYDPTHARFSLNNSKVYFLAIKGNAQYMSGFSNSEFNTSGLYCFDMRTKNISEAVKINGKYIINFELLY